MTLPLPDLDDRTFQGLVDEAKRMVQRRCPDWTDHNVSDPGVTLIETFAFMTDQLVYRLNRVPDRLYIKFLELIGVRLLPPAPAHADETFWLSGPTDTELLIPQATRVATARTETSPAVIFATSQDLKLIPCALSVVATQAADSELRIDQTDSLKRDTGFACFSEVPAPGDAIVIGLSEAVPRCAVQLRFRCTIRGVGVDPDHPPLIWEAWTGTDWVPCETDHDTTGGLNRDGDVVIHIPPSHEIAIIDQQRGGWIRGRVLESEEGQPAYSASPTVHALEAATIGGTIEVINAEIVQDEDLGNAEGVPGQRFQLRRFPVLAGASPAELQASSDEGWQEWTQVDSFASSSPEDRHFILDAVNGEIVLGPAVREPDGSYRRYGAVPDRGSAMRMHAYSVGGGRHGNVQERAISILKSSIPYVARVENRRPAQGGVDGETIDEAKLRGPITLRTRDRAVTAEDFEYIAREAAPEIRRVKAVSAGEEGVEAGSIRLLCVPRPRSDDPRIPFEELIVPEDSAARIAERLDSCRLIGTRISVEPPFYQGVTVVARLVARPRVNAERLQTTATAALYAYFNPITGGPDKDGWPWGRPVQSGEVFAVLQGLPGVEMVEDVRIFGADPISGQRAQQDTRRLELPSPSALVFSFEHQVLVEGAR